MNKTLNQKIWDRSDLKAQLLLFIGALLAASFIVVHNRTEPFSEIIKWPSYPPAMIFSTLIALVVGEFMYFMVLRAHRDFPTIMFPKEHFRYRIVYALLLPPVIAALLATVYFACYGVNIFTETVYFNKDFIIVITIVFIANVVMEAFFQSQRRFRYDPAMDPTEVVHYDIAVPDEKAIAEAQLRLVNDQQKSSLPKKTYVKRVSVQNDPCLAAIFILEKKLLAMDKNGEIVDWDDAIGKTSKYLPGTYFGLNQSFIINDETVISAWFDRSEVSYYVEPKFGLAVQKVSNKRVVKFKTWCNYHGILTPVVGNKAPNKKKSKGEAENEA